ncbi:MAG: hypothetical protein ACR2OR_16525 [Hyphomicrobiales bacterium]
MANALRTRIHEMWFWAKNFGNLATLKSMTSIGGKLAALTGKLNPYWHTLSAHVRFGSKTDGLGNLKKSLRCA